MLRSFYLATILLFTLSFFLLIFRTTSNGLHAAEDLGFANRLGMLLKRDINDNPIIPNTNPTNPTNPQFDDSQLNQFFQAVDSMGEPLGSKSLKDTYQGFFNQFQTWNPWASAKEAVEKLLLVRIVWWVLILFLAILQFVWVISVFFAAIVAWVIEGLKQCA